MENPFSFGVVVKGDRFINRHREICELTEEIKSRQNILLYADRRIGKTSLVNQVLHLLPKHYIKVFIDVSNIYSLEKFLETYTKRYFGSLKITSLAKLRDIVISCLPSFSPSATFNDKGEPTFSVNFKSPGIQRNAEDVFNLPAKNPNKKIVIVFDEFQEITNISAELPKMLRAAIQHHRHVSYVFCGSKRHLLLQMFNEKDQPFFKSARSMKISKIPKEDMIDFIKGGFKKGHIELTEEIPDKIIAITSNIPYHIQQLAHTLWFESMLSKKADNETLEKSFNSILDNFKDYFLEIWGNLSKGQCALLEAIARNGGKNILSSRYINENGLSSASSNAKNARILVEKNHLSEENGEFQFQDPFFRLWVLRNL